MGGIRIGSDGKIHVRVPSSLLLGRMAMSDTDDDDVLIRTKKFIPGFGDATLEWKRNTNMLRLSVPVGATAIVENVLLSGRDDGDSDTKTILLGSGVHNISLGPFSHQ